jgi:hypothetical protein
MSRHLCLSITLLVVASGGALKGFAQADDGQYLFYAKPALAKRKIIPANELKLCALGDTFNPPIKKQFKNIVSVGAGSRAQMLETGDCDVVMLYGQPLERVKNDYRGFAIYKISGDSLELAAEPEAGGWIAVGRMELAAQQTLEKKNISACGDGTLRDMFRPNPRIWKNWSNNGLAASEYLKTPKDLERENALLYGCDVWIFSPEDYKRFSSKYGTKYPLFDVSPDNPILTRKK